MTTRCHLARLGLEASPSAPGEARRAVTSWLEGWGAGEIVASAELLVSELVTNAITHAAPPVTLLVALDDDGVEIAVRDGSPRTPQQPHHHRSDDELAESGRGLPIVEALASDWGARQLPDGKWVFCRLKHPTPSNHDRGHRDPAASPFRLPSGRLITPR